MISSTKPLKIGKLYCYRPFNNEEKDYEYIYLALTDKTSDEMNLFYVIKGPQIPTNQLRNSYLTDLVNWHEF